FLPPLITEFSRQHPQYPHFRIFESTTAQILDEVAQGYSELGIIYLNDKNTKGIMQKLDKLHLQAIDLSDFQTHIYLRED
ncbi:LysR family transcriptional regulator, partial [Streptococcus pyogenes]